MPYLRSLLIKQTFRKGKRVSLLKAFKPNQASWRVAFKPN